MGATGVKLGTRFVTTHECDASIEFKYSYLDCNKNDLEIIKSPVGLPGRVIKNDFVKQIVIGNKKVFKCPWQCLKSCKIKEAPFCIAQALLNSAKGKMSNGFAFAGSKAYLATKLESVKEVFIDLIKNYNKAANIDKTFNLHFFNVAKKIAFQPVYNNN